LGIIPLGCSINKIVGSGLGFLFVKNNSYRVFTSEINYVEVVSDLYRWQINPVGCSLAIFNQTKINNIID